MPDLSTFSKLVLYILMALIALFDVVVLYWQIMVLRGGSMKNPDGSVDDWHEQKMLYGIAFADIFVACPVSLAGVILVFISYRWGFYLLALSCFWYVWGNTMTTATSLRFQKPKITPVWFISYPLGILIGLVYIIWTLANFDTIFAP
ncbi:MAG: hypothetical protein JXJ20_00175 [Anaerolineae bacterium]|jgi:hypothetical protein|nr:hypothetical protein [Anaerolineae bacterium]